MKERTRNLIRRWFSCLNGGDLGGLLELFSRSDDVRIRNAANPPLSGPDAPRRLLEKFFTRTAARHFEMTDAAEGDEQVFVSWTGTLTFSAGVQVADVVLPREMTVKLRGVERFQLDRDGKIVECDIVHETTSVPIAARRAVNS